MRLDRLATLFLARPLCALASLPVCGCVRILMYHRVSDEPESHLRPYYRLNTSPNRFAEQMQFLVDNRYSVVNLASAVSTLAKGGIANSDRKEVVITFDDGFADFAEHAAPVLRKYLFPATIFLPTAFIGEVPLQFKDKGVNCLTWNQVRELRASGMKFGSHTVTHPRLPNLTWPEIRQELADSKNAMEDRLQETVDTFAHPYAFPETDHPYVERLSKVLRDLGYNCCVTTRVGVAAAQDDRYTLKRLPVNECDDLPLFGAKLEGAYDWLAVPQRMIKELKSMRPARRFTTSPDL